MFEKIEISKFEPLFVELLNARVEGFSFKNEPQNNCCYCFMSCNDGNSFTVELPYSYFLNVYQSNTLQRLSLEILHKLVIGFLYQELSKEVVKKYNIVLPSGLNTFFQLPKFKVEKQASNYFFTYYK